MIIYVIRHPQTEWNREKRLQGWLDSPLTDEGRAVAHMLGEKLKEKGITKIYSSDLGRTLETSKIVNEYLHQEIIPTKELREQNLVTYNGRFKKDVPEKDYDENPNLAPPQGESMNQVRKRVLHFISGIKEDHSLIVTHGGCVQNILAAAKGIPLYAQECRIKQTEIVTLDTEELKVADVEEA